LSTGNLNFRAGLESNHKSTIEPRFNVFDIPQVDNTVTISTKEQGRVKTILYVIETPSYYGSALSEIYACVIAIGFEQHQVGDSNDPAVIAFLYENAFGAGDLLGSRLPGPRRWGKPLRYTRE